MKERNKLLLIGGICIFAIIGGLLLGMNKGSEPNSLFESQKEKGRIAPKNGKINYPALRNKIKNLINEAEPQKAYKVVKEEMGGYEFGVKHTAAHIVGEIIFDKEGLEGFTVCDPAFSFGCYHSFFGEALAEFGASVIEKLDKKCIEQYGKHASPCQHGIGHGIIEHFGHEELKKSLEACEKTQPINGHVGCPSGVFMEYNFPTKIVPGTATANIRNFNKENPYDPCNTEKVPTKFKTTCYYTINQWWARVFNRDFSKMGKFCSEIENEEFKKWCFRGAGNIAAPTTDYNLKKTKELCKKMPSNQAMKDCLVGSSWSFLASVPNRHLAPRLCENLKQENCITEKEIEKMNIPE